MSATTERCVHGEEVGDYCEDCDGGIPCAACGGLGRAGTAVCEECDGSGWWVYPLDLDPDWT